MHGVKLYYYIASLALFAIATILQYYTKRDFSVIGLVLFIIISAFDTATAYNSILLIAMSVISFLAMFLYAKKRFSYFYAMIIAAAMLFSVYLYYGPKSPYETMAFGIGAMFGIMHSGIETRYGKAKVQNKNIAAELKRDYLQVALGLILVVVIAVFGKYGIYASFYLTLLGVLGIGYSLNSKSEALSFFRTLEKDGVFFGRGAIFLAVGFTILESLYPSMRIALFGIAVLLFCDPAATIIGLKLGRLKLPYNRKKSYAGTIGYFAVGAIFGVVLIGYISLPIIFLLAFLESLSNKIDDNVSVAVVYGIVGALLA